MLYNIYKCFITYTLSNKNTNAKILSLNCDQFLYSLFSLPLSFHHLISLPLSLPHYHIRVRCLCYAKLPYLVTSSKAHGVSMVEVRPTGKFLPTRPCSKFRSMRTLGPHHTLLYYPLSSSDLS